MVGISESKREEIRKEAKKLLNNFQKSLDVAAQESRGHLKNLKSVKDSSRGVELSGKKGEKGEEGFRDEKEGENCDSEFRNSMFANAPERRGDCIIAEKKKW